MIKNTRPPLQRSHAPKCVESMKELPPESSYAGFNGATHRSAWRAHGRHSRAHRGTRFNGATHRSAWRGAHFERRRQRRVGLQRSHAPKCVESPGCVGITATNKPGFNGATHRSAWRVVATEPMARAGYLASTEPRTEVRGERTSRRITVRFGACFNGATHRSAWRGLPWRVGVLSRW